ncbi:MAG: DUF3368 domain-containing protein, partial [Verrucomicrobiota bacterium]
MIVISDTSVLVNLAAIGQLELLRKLYSGVIVPTKVMEEVRATADKSAPNRQVASCEWIEVRAVNDLKLEERIGANLDEGEAAAIALAIETRADFLLMDERRGRRVAEGEGLTVIGLLGVLVRAKSAGHISAVRPVLDDLVTSTSFYMTDALKAEVLSQAG